MKPEPVESKSRIFHHRFGQRFDQRCKGNISDVFKAQQSNGLFKCLVTWLLIMPNRCKSHQFKGDAGVQGYNPHNFLMVVGVVFTDVDELEENLRKARKRYGCIYFVADFWRAFHRFSP